jgi:hypothetical protein
MVSLGLSNELSHAKNGRQGKKLEPFLNREKYLRHPVLGWCNSSAALAKNYNFVYRYKRVISYLKARFLRVLLVYKLLHKLR